MLGIKADGIVKVLDGLLQLSEFDVGGASVVVGRDMFWVNPNGLTKVLNGPLGLAKFVVSSASVAVNIGG